MVVCNWCIEWCQTTPSSADPSMCVLQIGWRANGVDDAYSSTIYSTVSLPPANPDDYIPYSELTQEDMLNWCWSNGVDRAATEAALAQMIENQKKPPVIQPPLPWSND